MYLYYFLGAEAILIFMGILPVLVIFCPLGPTNFKKSGIISTAGKLLVSSYNEEILLWYPVMIKTPPHCFGQKLRKIEFTASSVS